MLQLRHALAAHFRAIIHQLKRTVEQLPSFRFTRQQGQIGRYRDHFARDCEATQFEFDKFESGIEYTNLLREIKFYGRIDLQILLDFAKLVRTDLSRLQVQAPQIDRPSSGVLKENVPRAAPWNLSLFSWSRGLDRRSAPPPIR